MSSLLLLDIGNSRVKWALVEPPLWLAEGAAAHDEANALMREWDRFPPPEKVFASNVAGEEPALAFTSYWRAREVPLLCIKTTAASCGVRNLYERPQQLGTDRWAALIGARARTHEACLVVSAGTAVTVDALNNKGEFLGGTILPGKHLMRESLATGTHALEKLDGQVAGFPRNTADAIESGIALALASAVHTAFHRLADASKTMPACILTGGDAEWLSAQLQIGAIIAPKLVLEGLLIMAQGDGQA